MKQNTIAIIFATRGLLGELLCTMTDIMKECHQFNLNMGEISNEVFSLIHSFQNSVQIYYPKPYQLKLKCSGIF